MADTHETEPILISETARDENRVLLEQFMGYAQTDPELLQRTLAIYDNDPDHVGSLAEFVLNNPEGFAEVVSILRDEPNGHGILRTVIQMFDSRADADLLIPDNLEQMIMNEPDFKTLVREGQKAPSNEIRGKIRRGFIIRLLTHTSEPAV